MSAANVKRTKRALEAQRKLELRKAVALVVDRSMRESFVIGMHLAAATDPEAGVVEYCALFNEAVKFRLENMPVPVTN
jgi:hypothetical protein